jgi:hypothetical protein
MSAEKTRRIHARKPTALRGVPPRYQVFDRRIDPPATVSVFYLDPDRDGVVFEVYDDDFREFLKRDSAFEGKRFEWVIDVDPDAPHDPRSSIIRPDPMPEPSDRGTENDTSLSLDQAVAATKTVDRYRVIQTSDPL